MTSKYFIFSIIFLGYGIFAYNRKSVSYTIPILLKDGMPSEQVGLILSAQNMAYAISKFIGGVASDRLSSKTLFSSGLAASALTAFLFAISNSVPLYACAWFLNGLAQGLGWPAIAKLLRKWFRPEELGLWWSAASASANLSGVFGPVLAVQLIANFGWRFSLVAAGLITLLAAALVYICIEDAPRATGGGGSPSKKTRPQADGESKSPSKSAPTKVVPFVEAMKTLLSRPSVWVISLAYLSASCAKTGIADWSQMYITTDLDMKPAVATTFLGTFELGGFCGGIVAGYFSDYFMRRLISINRGQLPRYGHPRVFVAIFFAIITGIAFYVLTRHTGPDTSFMFMQYIAMALGTTIFGQIALFGIAATETVASEISGTSHAIAALAANVGSVLAGLPFAALARNYSWYAVFEFLSILNTASVFMMISTIFMKYQ